MLAAIRAAREQHPARIVVAVPFAAGDPSIFFAPEADEVVCVHMPRELFAIGQFYEDFSQTTDDEVREALREFAIGPTSAIVRRCQQALRPSDDESAALPIARASTPAPVRRHP